MNMLQILDTYSNLEFHMKINITMLGNRLLLSEDIDTGVK